VFWCGVGIICAFRRKAQTDVDTFLHQYAESIVTSIFRAVNPVTRGFDLPPVTETSRAPNCTRK
jgi:hypothetical protein